VTPAMLRGRRGGGGGGVPNPFGDGTDEGVGAGRTAVMTASPVIGPRLSALVPWAHRSADQHLTSAYSGVVRFANGESVASLAHRGEWRALASRTVHTLLYAACADGLGACKDFARGRARPTATVAAMGSKTPSATLAIRSRSGDQEAAAELYRRAWPRALAIVRRSHGWDEAEDAVALGFAHALGRLDQIQEPGAVEAWMIRCATRAAIDLARRRCRAQPWGAPIDLPAGRGAEHDAGAESAADRALAGFERAALVRSLAQLPDDLGRLIVLRYLAGLSVPEVAARTGLPEGTVRRRCFDAYRLLRQRFWEQHLRPGVGECATVTDQLCRAASRNISARSRRRIDQHLGHCLGCRERQAALIEAIAERASRR
jgi:RNA polymerase sigma-70 factor, ECF subfamily